jgi:hypothetical protein
MIKFLVVLGTALALFAAGCTTVPREEKVIIHCPACGTELDAIFHKNF